VKLDILPSVPDEVDAALFGTIETYSYMQSDPSCLDVLQRLFNTDEVAGGPSPVMRAGDEDVLIVSAFGIINGIFMHFCPGYRLAVVEGSDEPRRIVVAKETT
jgi:hypothetical protein